MSHFDSDLIAALAEGSLDPDRAAALEREIAADPAAAAELSAQRAALGAIREASPIAMSDAERTRLRASVAEQLGIVRETSPKPAAVRRRRIHWPAIGVAAASLVAIVAIVPGVLRTAGDDADRAGTMVLAEEDATGSTRPPSADMADTTAPAFDAAAPEVLGSPEETTTAQAGEDGQVATTITPTTTTAPATSTTAAATTTARSVDPGLQDLIAAGVLVADDSVSACEAAARELVGEDAVASLVPFEGRDAVAWFIPGPEDPEALAVFDAADCALLASLP
jgi:anti-sigma factor RsiW